MHSVGAAVAEGCSRQFNPWPSPTSSKDSTQGSVGFCDAFVQRLPRVVRAEGWAGRHQKIYEHLQGLCPSRTQIGGLNDCIFFQEK